MRKIAVMVWVVFLVGVLAVFNLKVFAQEQKEEQKEEKGGEEAWIKADEVIAKRFKQEGLVIQFGEPVPGSASLSQRRPPYQWTLRILDAQQQPKEIPKELQEQDENEKGGKEQ